MPIIGGHHVLALQSPPEGWQAIPLLERCREYAGRPGARGAAARAVPGRDQRHAGVGVAPLDRGDRGRRGAAADAVAVSGRSLRRAAGGRLDRQRQTVGVAAASAAAVGCVLAGATAVARTAARSVLVEAAGHEPQRNALGSGPVRTLRIYLKLFAFCRREPFVEGAEGSNPSPSGEESANFQSLSIMRSTRATTCSGDPPRGHSTSA